MSIELTQKEKQKVIETFQSATQKMVKQLQEGKIVSLLEYYQLCQNAFKDDVWLGAITKLSYKYTDYSFLYVKIKCKFLDTRFKISFHMGEPNGKFEDKTPIAYNINIEEVFKYNG